jgi:ABC-type glycerol-3-phosphate transport system substrate-binding protein
MQTTIRKPWLAIGLTVLALAGCGGGGSAAVDATAPLQGSAAVLDFLNKLIASSNESDEPIDVDAVVLALDDAAEPAAF